MKALLINGSPHKEGNTFIALTEVAKQLEKNGIETEILWIGNKPVRGCIACNVCKQKGICAFPDELYTEMREALFSADALIVGSPTYYGGPNGSLCALLDRLFYSTPAEYYANKVAASVAVCRRGGATTTFQRLNMYFEMLNMPMATSQYWNIVYGRTPGESAQDKEGLQTMRMLAENVSWLLKSIKNGGVPKPEREAWDMYSFIR